MEWARFMCIPHHFHAYYVCEEGISVCMLCVYVCVVFCFYKVKCVIALV